MINLSIIQSNLEFLFLFCWIFFGGLFFFDEPINWYSRLGFFCWLIHLALIFFLCLNSFFSLFAFVVPKLVWLIVALFSFFLSILYDFNEFMLPRFCTIFSTGLFYFLTFIQKWPISFLEATTTLFFVTTFFLFIYFLSLWWYGFTGLGEGDVEIIGLPAVLFGSKIGIILVFSGILGLFYFHFFGREQRKIPFGGMISVISLFFLIDEHVFSIPYFSNVLNKVEIFFGV